jgi:hypothetical protein
MVDSFGESCIKTVISVFVRITAARTVSSWPFVVMERRHVGSDGGLAAHVGVVPVTRLPGSGWAGGLACGVFRIQNLGFGTAGIVAWSDGCAIRLIAKAAERLDAPGITPRVDPWPLQPMLSALILHVASVARLEAWQTEHTAPSGIQCWHSPLQLCS